MAWELSLVELNVSHAVSRNQLKVLVLRAKKVRLCGENDWQAVDSTYRIKFNCCGDYRSKQTLPLFSHHHSLSLTRNNDTFNSRIYLLPSKSFAMSATKDKSKVHKLSLKGEDQTRAV